MLHNDDRHDGDTPFDDGGADAEERPAVLVRTTIQIPVSVQRLEDPRAPEGICLGTFIGERLVARCAMPDDAIRQLLDMNLFADPVKLGLFVVEENPGLQCRLFAFVPSDKLRDADAPDEPWKASVPTYEESRHTNAAADGATSYGDDDDSDMGDDPRVLLGHIVRFDHDRKHGDDLAAEAIDILQKIIQGGPLDEADTKAIDALLDSL
jgi:hypothetical protein